MITIIDYGAGNLKSVVNAFNASGSRPVITQNPNDLYKASAIILPGVGAFGDGMAKLQALGMIPALNEVVLERKVPFLGICLGLQFLAEKSFEMGEFPGLGWIKGSVVKINPNGVRLRIPHMGWNDIKISQETPLFENLEAPIFYFVHSYYLLTSTKDSRYLTSTTFYGAELTASLQKGNIFAVQFHPEKSQQNGLTVLKNFLKLI
jgi:glutamine amidotransferase